MKTKSIDQQIFEVVDSIGETLDGLIHILDISDYIHGPREEHEITYRIYHAEGYCMTVKRDPHFDDEDKLQFEYDFDGSMEEFKPIAALPALRLLKDHFNIK